MARPRQGQVNRHFLENWCGDLSCEGNTWANSQYRIETIVGNVNFAGNRYYNHSDFTRIYWVQTRCCCSLETSVSTPHFYFTI